MKWCQYYTTFVCFADTKDKEDGKMHNNATCSFIKTDDANFAIINKHVLFAFRKKKETIKDLVFQVGSYPLDIDKCIIDISKAHDLVTLKIPDDVWFELEKEGKRYCYCKSWPPKRVVTGETVIYLGFPGCLKERLSRLEYNFHIVALTEVVDSVSENQFVILIDRATWIKRFGVKDISELKDYGGFSGSIIMRLSDNGVTLLEPVGVVSESGVDIEMHIVCHVDYIQKNGKISE